MPLVATTKQGHAIGFVLLFTHYARRSCRSWTITTKMRTIHRSADDFGRTWQRGHNSHYSLWKARSRAKRFNGFFGRRTAYGAFKESQDKSSGRRFMRAAAFGRILQHECNATGQVLPNCYQILVTAMRSRNDKSRKPLSLRLLRLARTTGLEPATTGSTVSKTVPGDVASKRWKSRHSLGFPAFRQPLRRPGSSPHITRFHPISGRFYAFSMRVGTPLIVPSSDHF